MIELPEAITITNDLKKTILGKKVKKCLANESPHSFTWYYKDFNDYNNLLKGKSVTAVRHYGFYVMIELENAKLLFRDGVNIRYYENSKDTPKKRQLYVEFDDATYIICTVSMYGGIMCYLNNDFEDNEYFIKAKAGILPNSDEFTYEYFNDLYNRSDSKLSSKGFLGTEQRFIGIGNGTIQDILFNAGIHPKRKINTYIDKDKKALYNSIKDTLYVMTSDRGRDTEKDIFGNQGKYKTVLSKNTVNLPCPICSSLINKENFLGGSIYYCSNCQK